MKVPLVVSACNERLVAVPRHLRKVCIGLRLFEHCLQLSQRSLRLQNLIIQFRHRNLGQQLAFLYVIADIDLALFDVTAGACEDLNILEG